MKGINDDESEWVFLRPSNCEYVSCTLLTVRYTGEGMDDMEFTEAESNMNDLVSEYQQYQVRYRAGF